MAGFLHADSRHSDDYGGENRYEGCDGEMAHVAELTRERADVADDQPDDAEDDGAGAVRGDGVHHDGEGQDVRAHYEDEEKELCSAEDFAAPPPEQDFTGIGHVVDEGVGELELADYVAGIGGNEAETEDEDHAPGCGEIGIFGGSKEERRHTVRCQWRPTQTVGRGYLAR